MTLPIFKLLAAACVLTWERRHALLRAVWPPLTLGILLSFAEMLWLGDSTKHPAASSLLALFTFLMTVMLSVRSYRVFLLGREQQAGNLFRWSIRETQFLVVVLGLGMALLSAALVTGAAMSVALPGASNMGAAAAMALIVPAGYVASRLMLAFPAISVEEGTSAIGALRTAWYTSRHNGWRLLIVCVLVPALLGWLVGSLSLLPVPGIDFVLTIVVWLLLPAHLSILALAYAQLNRPAAVLP